jgi:hypothetical protein
MTDISDIFERRALHAGGNITPFVTRPSNPVTGAATPQHPGAPSAPVPPSVDGSFFGETTLAETTIVPSTKPIPVPAPVPSGSAFFVATDYGMIGDGATDNTTACQAWLDAASGKGTAYLPSGHFQIRSGVINVPSFTTIFGDGPASRLNFVSATGSYNLQAAGKIKIRYSNIRISAIGATIFQGCIRTPTSGCGLVDFDSCLDVVVDRCEIDGAAAEGIFVANNTSGVALYGNVVHDTLGDGIGGAYYGSNNVRIWGNEIYNSGDDGIAIISGTVQPNPSFNIIIEGNNVHHAGFNGAQGSGITYLGVRGTIRGNIIHDCYNLGIQLYDQTIPGSGVVNQSLEVEGNDITSTQLGILVESIRDVRIVGNKIRNTFARGGSGSSGYGILIRRYGKNIIVEGNIINNVSSDSVPAFGTGILILQQSIPVAGTVGTVGYQLYSAFGEPIPLATGTTAGGCVGSGGCAGYDMISVRHNHVSGCASDGLVISGEPNRHIMAAMVRDNKTFNNNIAGISAEDLSIGNVDNLDEKDNLLGPPASAWLSSPRTITACTAATGAGNLGWFYL